MHRGFWNGITLEDIIRAFQFHVKVNFATCTDMKNFYKSIARKMETQQPGADVIVKKRQPITLGRSFSKNKTQLIRLLSQYLNEDIHTIINCEDAADTHIVHANLYFACEKNLTIFADETGIVVYTTFVLLEQ